MTIGVFGPRVLGEEAHRREQAIVEKAAHIYGPRVTGEVVPLLEKSAATPVDKTSGPHSDQKGGADQSGEGSAAAGADKYLSVKELEQALEANPALVDPFLEQEEQRELPRSTALVKLEKAEMARPGGPRRSILDRIKALAVKLGQDSDL